MSADGRALAPQAWAARPSRSQRRWRRAGAQPHAMGLTIPTRETPICTRCSSAPSLPAGQGWQGRTSAPGTWRQALPSPARPPRPRASALASSPSLCPPSSRHHCLSISRRPRSLRHNKGRVAPAARRPAAPLDALTAPSSGAVGGLTTGPIRPPPSPIPGSRMLPSSAQDVYSPCSVLGTRERALGPRAQSSGPACPLGQGGPEGTPPGGSATCKTSTHRTLSPHATSAASAAVCPASTVFPDP